MNYTAVHQQTILGMECTKTPLELVSIHFCGGNYLVINLGYSVPFSTEVTERV